MAYIGKEDFMKVILGCVLILFSAVAVWGAQATKMQFALNWKAEPEFGGFYAAKLSRYFQKRNLDVEITEGGAGTPALWATQRKMGDSSSPPSFAASPCPRVSASPRRLILRILG